MPTDPTGDSPCSCKGQFHRALTLNAPPLDTAAESLLDQLPVAIFTIDLDSRITSLRGSALPTMRVDASRVVGRTLHEIFDTKDPQNVQMLGYREALAGRSHSHETTYADGVAYTIMNPQRTPAGEICGVVAVALDVTHHKNAIRALEHTHAKLMEAQELAGLGSYECDLLTGDVWASQMAYQLLGAEPATHLPSIALWRRAVHPDDLERYLEIVEPAVANGMPFVVDHRVVGFKGEERWIHHRGDFQHDEDGRPIRLNGTLLDITERKLAEERLSYLAHRDELTGISNRTLFLDRLTKAVARGRRGTSMFAVLFIDLDRMKAINDSYGHRVGDTLLRDCAVRMRTVLREDDTFARMGGDEFGVLLPGVRRIEDAFLTARRLLDALEVPLPGQTSPAVTASIGISVHPHDGTDAEVLLLHADTAMYAAKQAGGRCFQLYTPALHDAAIEKLLLESNLRAAIENDQLFLQYQPVVDCDGEPVMVEALVRWKHPRKGMIPPVEFIPLAEESDLIVVLGEWVLRRACRQLVEWHARGMKDLRVAVNASARQLVHEGFAALVAEVLEETGLDGRFLEIEITESAFIDIKRAIEHMREIKALGVTLAVDDFGTGFSSLAYLQRLPVDALKIDRSFISALGESDGADAIPRAIVTLGKSLSLRVTAEGVESISQAQSLRVMGCDEMQGYYFSRPLSPPDLEQMLAGASRALGDPEPLALPAP